MDAARKGTCLPGAVDEASTLPGRMTEGRHARPFVRSFAAHHAALASVMRQRACHLRYEERQLKGDSRHDGSRRPRQPPHGRHADPMRQPAPPGPRCWVPRGCACCYSPWQGQPVPGNWLPPALTSTSHRDRQRQISLTHRCIMHAPSRRARGLEQEWHLQHSSHSCPQSEIPRADTGNN